MRRHLIILSTPTDFNIKEHLPPRKIIYTDPMEYDTDSLGGGDDHVNLAIRLAESFFTAANWDWFTKEGVTEALLSSREILAAMPESDRSALRLNVLSVREKIAARRFREDE